MAERNHEVERIYMSKLRDVESAAWVLEKKRNVYLRDIKKLRCLLAEPAKPILRVEGYDEWGKIIGAYWFGLFMAALLAGVGNYVIEIFESGAFAAGFVKTLGAGTIFFIIAIIVCLIRTANNNKENERSYNIAMDRYIEQKKNIEKQYKSNCQAADKIEKKLFELNDEISKVKNVRDELYSVNWMAGNYRNIRVVYYICDMVMTADISIDEALKYYLLQEINNKLDLILQKLDRIIEQQAEIIAGNAVLEAQNEQLIKENKMMITKMSSIEDNTRLAADYAKVGSAYSEANAYFSLATYLKNK